jgi:hypothetical protein
MTSRASERGGSAGVVTVWRRCGEGGEGGAGGETGEDGAFVVLGERGEGGGDGGRRDGPGGAPA